MIHDIGLVVGITWFLLPYIIVISIIMVTIWMLIQWIPIWIKRWNELDDDWWSK